MVVPHRTAQEIAILTWITDVLDPFKGSTHPAFQVVFANQEMGGTEQAGAPIPEPPWASLLVTTTEHLGHLECDTFDTVVGNDGFGDLFDHQVSGHFIGTASVTLIGTQHREMARRLTMSLRFPSVQRQTEAAGVYLLEQLDAVEASALLGVEFEPRTVIDFRFAYGHVEAIPVETIEDCVKAITVE